MIAAKHTPGPLHVRTTSIDVVLQGVTHILCDTNEIPVAFCPSWKDDPEEAAEAAANLRLFEAAPDMLDELTAQADGCSAIIMMLDGQSSAGAATLVSMLRMQEQAARAAIAKAEGRSDG